MRPHPRDPDALGPVPFTLAAAVATGLVRSLGEIVQPRGGAVLGIAVLSFAAMALILWLGIRRQWEPVWSTALQLTVAWTVADLLAFPVAIAVAVPNVHAFPWRDAAINVGSAQLGMALVRFPITLGLVAAGRHFLRLHQTRTAVAASDLAAHVDPVG